MGSKILNVPYKSQNDADANLKHTDCGPCCIAMILGAMGQTVTTNAVTAASGMQGDNGLMQSQVVNAAKAFGLNMDWQAGYTLDILKTFIDNGQPPIALIKYGNIPDRVDRNFAGGHYVVVVGYDDATHRVFINDPDYYPGTNGGFQKAYDYETWKSAWGGFAAGENYNWCLIVPKPAQSIGGEGIPAPAPQPVGTTSTMWVIAPAGLLFRSQPNAAAGVIGGLVFGQQLTAIGAETAPADASGRTWQQVETQAGITGWVAASLNGDRLLAAQKPADPYLVQVMDNQPIRDAGGLAVRDSRNILLNPIDRVQAGERMTVYQRVVESDGTPWLWVQSPRNQYGWARETSQGVALVSKVTPDLGGTSTGATPEPERNTGTPVATTSDVWIIATDGLILREQSSRSSKPILGIPYGDHLIAEGPTAGPDAENIVWQQVVTDAKQRGWVASNYQGEVTLSTTKPVITITSVVPWGKCYAGLGMAEARVLAAQELGVIRKSKIEAFKLLTTGDADENKQNIGELRKIRPDMFIAARLFFSVNPGHDFSAQDFVDFVNNGITACVEMGVEYFEVHNEPNIPEEGMDWKWTSGNAFGDWLIQVLGILRQRFPNAKFGYPGLSPKPNVPAFLDGSANAIAQCDWLGVHNYWTSADQPPFPMTGDNAGMGWKYYRTRFPDKLLMITEFSNNSKDMADTDKGNQYAKYYQLLRQEPNLGAAFAFALNWPNQDKNREGWIFNNSEAQIASLVAAAVSKAGF